MEIPQANPYPARLKRSRLGITLELVDLPANSFIDPFIETTLARNASAKRRSIRLQSSDLETCAAASRELSPVGFILHTSRCGSTLESQLLRKIPGLVVYSEPPVINDLLLYADDLPKSELVQIIRYVINLLGRHAVAPFAIKLRSWNCLHVDLIRAAFPDAPWTFTYRDPIEVGVSTMSRPPTWMRALTWKNNPFRQYALKYCDSLAPEDYFASIYAAFCDSIVNALDPAGKLVNYSSLPSSIWESICPHFGLKVPQLVERAMADSARFYSKSLIGSPKLFASDSETKQLSCSERLRRAVEVTAESRYRQLLLLTRDQNKYNGTASNTHIKIED